MPLPSRIEGFAIISADGMIADASGHMPAALRIAPDQEFFYAALGHAAAVVHGRYSHEGGAAAAGRHRLIVTRRVSALAPDTMHPMALLWNPVGASFAQAWRALGASDGMLAVIGGTDVYSLFWQLGYDAFHLTRAAQVRLPGGRPVFRELTGDRTPDSVLASYGLRPAETRVLEASAGVTLVTWRR
ncbi:MAG TPA: dihydrofolate reductase [Xanthobacteraceae bacterium]|jgi:dihydrofolate reductase